MLTSIQHVRSRETIWEKLEGWKSIKYSDPHSDLHKLSLKNKYTRGQKQIAFRGIISLEAMWTFSLVTAGKVKVTASMTEQLGKNEFLWQQQGHFKIRK